jgi:hypothetical protein
LNRLDSCNLLLIALRLAPLMLFAVLCVVFGLLSDRFLSLANFRNILTQSTHVAVMAIGMTFVLLVRGVDLSIGSVMYLVAVVMGLYLSEVSLFAAVPAILLIGAAFGAINACFITGRASPRSSLRLRLCSSAGGSLSISPRPRWFSRATPCRSWGGLRSSVCRGRSGSPSSSRQSRGSR